MPDREKILKAIEPVIYDYIDKATKARYRNGGDSYKLRIAYCNALSRLLSVYNQVYANLELEEIQKEIEALKNEKEVK